MAELAAISIAANIIQLVDFTAKVTARIVEFNSSVGDVPKSFRHINAELSVLKYTVTQLHKTFQSDTIDPAIQNALIPALSECNNVLKSLTELLENTLPNDTDSRVGKGIKAFISLINSSEVQDLIKRLRHLTRSLVYASLPLRSFENLNLVKLQKWVRVFDTVDASRFRWSNAMTHAPGTGAWFLHSEQFELWLRNAQSLLWLHGMPGRGKSVLSTTILQRICNQQQLEPGIAVAYFFFSFRVEASRDPDNLILSLITQLAPQSLNLSEDFEQLYTSCGNGTFRPSPPVALRLLGLILASLPEVFIVLDALDECLSHRHIIETLKELIDWRLDNVHIIFTSRREQTFVKYFDRILQANQIVDLENTIVDRDIGIYVQDRLMDSKWKDDGDARKAIQTTLSRSNGMFRWAALQMDAIEKCINKRSLHATLDTLPQDLDETYERILLAIPEVNRAYAKRLLIWVTYSREPQRLESLAEAAAIDPSDHDPISDDNKPRSPLDILTLCQGLIAPITSDTYGRPVSERYQGYALSHFSVREYLESNRIRNSPARAFRLDKTKSDTFLTGACVTYLHQWQESVPLECWHEELERSDLARYCKETWLHHARAAEPISELVLKLVITYLGTDFEYYDHTRSFHFFPETKEPEQENGPLTVKLRYRRLLKCACRTGLPSLVRLVLKTEFSCCPVRKRTRDRVTAAPLRYPVYFANLLLFEFMGLLHFSYRLWANSERVDFIILSALLTAQLLVFWHIAVESYNPKMIESDPPLQLAARSGSVPVAQALLGAGEDQRWPLYDPEVSLFEAVTRNNTDMAQYLLSNCSYRSISNTLGRAIACPRSRKGRGHVTPQIARILLRSSPGVRAASKYNEADWIARIPPHGYSGARLEVGVVPTLMHLIAVQGFFQAFDSEETRLALSDILAYTTASSIHETNSDGDTPLHLAAGQRCRELLSVSLDGISKAIVQYLLQVGASPSIQNSHGATPLHLVGFVPKQGIRDELLELFAMYQANPDAPDKQGRTLLHAVACVDDGITHAMKCFPHATLDQRDSEGNTPLHFAASCGNSEGGLALLRLSADATARNHAGVTPLHMLCRLGSIWRISVDSDGEKVRTAQLDLEFPWGRPTDWINNTDGRAAKLREHQNFAQKICQAGADINALDEKGNSALHWACLYWGPARMLNIFRDLGAEINRLNSQGQTPLDFIADESSEVVSERTRRWENLDAMYVENRAWLRNLGGRTAKEINASQ